MQTHTQRHRHTHTDTDTDTKKTISDNHLRGVVKIPTLAASADTSTPVWATLDVGAVWKTTTPRFICIYGEAPMIDL